MKTFCRTFGLIAAVSVIIGTNIFSGCRKSNGHDDYLTGRNLAVYGKIFTADRSGSIVEAFVVKDGRFVYVGPKAGAAEHITPDMKVIDCGGKGLVIPGCTEGHGHFIGIDGIARNLPGFRASYKDLVKTFIPEKMQKNPGAFLSFGWPTQDVEKFSTRDYAMEIEEVSGGYPVVLLDGGGHNALCNRTALRKAGLVDESGRRIRDVRGGDIVTIQGSDNIASGYLTDEVVPFVLENSLGTILDDAGYMEACKGAVQELNRRGFTSYMDAYINSFDDAATYKYLSRMDKEGTLSLNVMGYYTIRSYDWGLPKGGAMPQRVADKLDRIGELSAQYTKGHVRANGVKLFADGVVETYTGWISREYTVEGLPEEKKHGNKIWDQEELNAIVAAANAKGMPVHTHTFGDLACNAMINACCASPSASSLKIRNSLAHVRNISEEDIARCGRSNIGIASNLIWHAGDPQEYRDYFYSIMPLEVYESGYPMKSLLNAGIVVSSSTDAPCGETIPGTVPNIIGVTVTGLYPDHMDAAPLAPDELLTVRQALECLTMGGAASLGLEKDRGSIEVGKYADFVVLDKDVLELEAQGKQKEIFQVGVTDTWFEGRQVYSRQESLRCQ